MALRSIEIKKKPISFKILDEPIVLFRNKENKVSALTDRCPHRNVNLSKGKVVKGNLQCPYHGWEFNQEGKCVFIPSLCDNDKIPNTACTNSYPVIEQDGVIWLWLGDRKPFDNELPFNIPNYNNSKWKHTWVVGNLKNSVDNVIENFIDTTHTGYIHAGLFRNPASHLAKTKVTKVDDGVIIDIDEETGNSDSLFSKILLGKNEYNTHQDQFILPSIVKVDYGFGNDKHIIAYQICIPVEDFLTKVYVCVTWKFGVLTNFINPLVKIIGDKVLNQDVWVLENQSNVIKKYGEHFVSTPADTANNWIRIARQNAKNGIKSTSKDQRDINFRL